MMFFSSNVGSAVVMLFSTILFTIDTVLMGVVLIRVSVTVTFHTSLTTNHAHTYKLHVNAILYLSNRYGPKWELRSSFFLNVRHLSLRTFLTFLNGTRWFSGLLIERS